MLSTVLTNAGPYVTAFFTFIGGVYVARRNAATSERAGERAHLQTLLDQQRKDFDSVIGPIRADLDAVRREVSELRTALDQIRALYHSALDYIRKLRKLWPSGTAAPDIPEDLRDQV